MKKVLNAILVIIFLLQLSIPTPTCAADNSEKEEEMVAFLHFLGILPDDLEAKTADDMISRGEFAVYTAKMYHIGEDLESDKIYFTDIDTESAYRSSIHFLVESGVVSLNDERCFRPNETITGYEAVKMMAAITGYGAYAMNKGGYPLGYLSAARSSGIIDGSFSDHPLNFYEAAKLIADTLMAPTYEMVGFSENSIRYSAAENKTLLENNFKIAFEEGKVTDINCFAFSGHSVDDGQFRMNGNVYQAEDICEDMAGKEYKIFYDIQKNSQPRHCIYRIQTSSRDVLLLKLEDVQEMNRDYELSYWKDDSRMGKIRVEQNAFVYFNGAEVDRDVTGIFERGTTGTIYLMDMDGNGIYDAVSVKSYVPMVVANIDRAVRKIYDTISGTSLELYDKEFVRIYSSAGVLSDWSAIAEKSILAVAASENYAEIYVSADIVSGTITQVKEDRICVNDKEYKLDAALDDVVKAKLTLGAAGEFYINYFGKLVFMLSKAADGFQYGFVYKAAKGADQFADTAMLKLFSQNGVIMELNLADKVTVDGVTKRGAKSIVNAIPECSYDNMYIEPQMLRYSTNSEGKISKLDTLYFNPEHEDMRSSISKTEQTPLRTGIQELTCGTAGSNCKRFGMSTLISPSTIIMKVPSNDDLDSAEDIQFNLGAFGDFNHQSSYLIESYKTNYYGGIEDIVLQRSNGLSLINQSDMILIDEIADTIDENGNDVVRISGMSYSLPVTYNVLPESFEGNVRFDLGDTILACFDNSGRIASYMLLYDYSSGGYPGEQVHKIEDDGSESSNWNSLNYYNKATDATTYYQALQFSYVFAGYKDGNIIKCFKQPTVDVNSSSCDEIYDVSKLPIMVYDGTLKNSKAYLGSIADVQDIKTFGADQCSRLIIQTKHFGIRGIVVYK